MAERRAFITALLERSSSHAITNPTTPPTSISATCTIIHSLLQLSVPDRRFLPARANRAAAPLPDRACGSHTSGNAFLVWDQTPRLACLRRPPVSSPAPFRADKACAWLLLL